LNETFLELLFSKHDYGNLKYKLLENIFWSFKNKISYLIQIFFRHDFSIGVGEDGFEQFRRRELSDSGKLVAEKNGQLD
jgi:hypothetical protein